MEIFLVILAFLAVARACGEVAERLRVPALVGELAAGVLLGALAQPLAAWFPVFGTLGENAVFRSMTDLGMFFLMLLAGVEMEPRDISEASGRAFLVAAGGMVLPLMLGVSLGWYLLPESPYRFAQAMFLGTALSITAVPATVQVLMNMNRLHTVMGRTVVSAALFDDVLSLFILAVLVPIVISGSLPTVGVLLGLAGKVVLFFVITLPVGWYVFPWLGRYFRYLRMPEADFSMLLAAALGYALLAEWLGLHFIVGAFIAGVFFQRRTVHRLVYARVEEQLSGLTAGFLAPIFFASMGLHLDLAAVGNVPGFVALVIAIAFVSKVVGAGLPARWSGLSRHDSLLVGVAMSGRGAVELIIANLALRHGLFDQPQPVPPLVEGLFSTVVVMAVVTTIVMPILMSAVAAHAAKARRPAPAPAPAGGGDGSPGGGSREGGPGV